MTAIIIKLNRQVKNIVKRMGFKVTDLPNDVDGDVLRSLSEKGVDLTKPREIEFYCYAPDYKIASQIVGELSQHGFTPHIYDDGEEDNDASKRFSVYNAKMMVPTYQDIIETQRILNSLLKPFGTECDGWGTLSDEPKKL